MFVFSLGAVRCFRRAVESFRALERARGAVGPRGFIVLSQPHTHIVQSPYYTHTKFTYYSTSITSRRSTPRPIARAQHQNTARARPIARRSASVDRSVAIVEANRCGARWTRRRAVVTLGRDRRRRHHHHRSSRRVRPVRRRARRRRTVVRRGRRGERGEALTSRATRSARR